MNARRFPSTLGVDPGGPGAAVMLDCSGRLVFASCWKANRKGWRLRTWIPEADEAFTDQLPGRTSAIGHALTEMTVNVGWKLTALACEKAFLHREHRNAQTAMDLANFGGSVLSPLEDHCNTAAEYVLAGEWRALLLRMRRNTPRAQAKAASLRYIPAMVPGLPEAIAALGPFAPLSKPYGNHGDHLTDAAGIALWRQRTAARAS